MSSFSQSTSLHLRPEQAWTVVLSQLVAELGAHPTREQLLSAADALCWALCLTGVSELQREVDNLTAALVLVSFYSTPAPAADLQVAA